MSRKILRGEKQESLYAKYMSVQLPDHCQTKPASQSQPKVNNLGNLRELTRPPPAQAPCFSSLRLLWRPGESVLNPTPGFGLTSAGEARLCVWSLMDDR